MCHKEQPNNRASPSGSIIVFALSAIAAMAITAALLTIIAIFEVRKSANVERAFVARYRAESGIENSLYLLNQSLAKQKTIIDIKRIFGFNDTANFAEKLNCGVGGADANDNGCQTDIESLEVKFGAQTVQFNISKDKALTVNVFDPDDKNQPPYNLYNISELRASGLSGLDTEEFEVTFITWNYNTLVINSPVKRLLKDSSDGATTPGVAILPFPVSIDITIEPTIGDLGTNSGLIGIIRIRLLRPANLNGLTLQFFNSSGNSVCDAVTGPAQCIPGFIEVTSVGKDDASSNKQAMKVVATIPTADNQASDIWDYVVFSNVSLSK